MGFLICYYIGAWMRALSAKPNRFGWEPTSWTAPSRPALCRRLSVSAGGVKHVLKLTLQEFAVGVARQGLGEEPDVPWDLEG